MNLFSENLKRLQAHDPALAKRVSAANKTETVQVALSKDGHPVPRIGSVSLHSTYRPKEEAERMVSEFVVKEGLQTIIYGLGFGYHVEEMLKKVSSPVTVVEPSMEIFRAFFRGMVGLLSIMSGEGETNFVRDPNNSKWITEVNTGEWPTLSSRIPCIFRFHNKNQRFF